jgi:hypothetical protein
MADLLQHSRDPRHQLLQGTTPAPISKLVCERSAIKVQSYAAMGISLVLLPYPNTPPNAFIQLIMLYMYVKEDTQ